MRKNQLPSIVSIVMYCIVEAHSGLYCLIQESDDQCSFGSYCDASL